MSEIAKCPMCGEKPRWFPITGWETGWKTDMLMCCGYGSTAVRGWNKLAAAMECQARHTALVEAVEKERSFPLELVARNGTMKMHMEYQAARAEVDRLLEEK